MTDLTVDLFYGASTDRGLRRAVNEDSYIAARPVFLVADGMGGHSAGAEASRTALEGFQLLVGRDSVEVADIERAFARAVLQVESIETSATAPGTTLTGAALCVHGGIPYWLIINVGDSRTYRMRDGILQQVSIDHSAVQAMLDRGEIDLAESEQHPQRNVITRAVGAGSIGTPDYWLLPVEADDRIMVCSDGLTKELSVDEIALALADEPSPQGAATRLVHEALLRGGRDNVTVVVVDAQSRGDLDDEPTLPTPEWDHDTSPHSREEGGHHAPLRPW